MSKQKDISEEPIIVPDWMPKDAWEAFLDMRKKKKNPLNTARMINRQIKRLDGFRQAGYNIEEILDTSTNEQWDDTYPIRQNKAGYESRKDASRTAAAAGIGLGGSRNGKIHTIDEDGNCID